MGIVVCEGEGDIRREWDRTSERAEVLFKNRGLFVERFVKEGRHVEVQVSTVCFLLVFWYTGQGLWRSGYCGDADRHSCTKYTRCQSFTPTLSLML